MARELPLQRCRATGGVAATLARVALHSATMPSAKKPLVRVSKRLPGAHGKMGIGEGGQKGWQRVGEGLAKG